jgi:DNA-binding NarL/FixJ family response regulator
VSAGFERGTRFLRERWQRRHGPEESSRATTPWLRPMPVGSLHAVDGTIGVAIVDDHPIVIDSLRSRLAETGVSVVSEHAAVEDPALDVHAVDVVVCDLRLPGRSGADAVSFLTERGATVLAVSGFAPIDVVLDTVAAGARGFVSKAAAGRTFVDAVHSVATGHVYLTAEVANWIREDADRRPLPTDDIGGLERDVLRRFEQGDLAPEVAAEIGFDADRFAALMEGIWERAGRRRRAHMPTERERELMALVAAGLSHRDVAARMYLAASTVPDKLKSIKAKYLATHPEEPADIPPKVAASRWAREIGLV